MELQQLRYVVELAAEDTVSAAAEACGVTQPTLSQQLKKLEQELGEDLFERTSKGVRMTPSGRMFVKRARRILDEVRQARQEIGASELRGELRVGTIPTVGPYLLPRVTKWLDEQAPELQLRVTERTTSGLLEAMERGQLDILLLSLPIEATGLETNGIGQEPFQLCASNGHEVAQRSSVEVERLQEEPLLLLEEGHCFRDQSLSFCQQQEVEPQVVFEGSNLLSAMNMAATDQGITILPKMAVEATDRPDLCFIPFDDPKPTRMIGLATRTSCTNDPAVELFQQAVDTAFNDPLKISNNL